MDGSGSRYGIEGERRGELLVQLEYSNIGMLMMRGESLW